MSNGLNPYYMSFYHNLMCCSCTDLPPRPKPPSPNKYLDDLLAEGFEESNLRASSPCRLTIDALHYDAELDEQDFLAQGQEFIDLDEEQDELVLTPGVLSVDSPSTPASPAQQPERMDVDVEEELEGALPVDEFFEDIVDTALTPEIRDPWACLDMYAQDFYAGGDFAGDLVGGADRNYDPSALEILREHMMSSARRDRHREADVQMPEVAITDMTVDNGLHQRDTGTSYRPTLRIRSDIMLAPPVVRDPPPHLMPAPFAPPPFASPPKPGHSLSGSPERLLPRAHDRSESPPRAAPNGHVDWLNPPAFPVRARTGSPAKVEAEMMREEEDWEEEVVVVEQRQEMEEEQEQEVMDVEQDPEQEPEGMEVEQNQDEDEAREQEDLKVERDQVVIAVAHEGSDEHKGEGEAEVSGDSVIEDAQEGFAPAQDAVEVIEVDEDMAGPAEEPSLSEIQVVEEHAIDERPYIVEESDEGRKSAPRVIGADVMSVKGGYDEVTEYVIEETVSVQRIEVRGRLVKWFRTAHHISQAHDEYEQVLPNGDIASTFDRESSIASSRAEDATITEFTEVFETVYPYPDPDKAANEAMQEIIPRRSYTEVCPNVVSIRMV